MYTPQRKPFPASDRKGKAVAFADEITTPSPPKGLRDGRFGPASGSAVVGDWRTFKDVGLLDEASLERKELDAVRDKNLKLEKELFDYQHSMGLLLIEKKKWTSTNEELQQTFDEAKEILKRERTSNLMALSESEKREENLRKALISEKQFVAELERNLKYLQQEHSVMKSTSEAKLAEADALVMSTKEKALEVDRERAIAEEKLSVINRKSSELERRLKEAETREKVLQRERLSLATEREAHEAVFYKQREDLQEWEKKLTIEEDRLSEIKRSINHIEERSIESERIIKKKEKSLEEMQQKIDIAKSELKEREESISIKLNDISMKEKDFETVKTKVDLKEKELRELEEKLTVREQREIEKLLDDQKAVLDSRMQEFEKELEQRRMSFDEELEKLQVEIGHKGEQLGKRDASLEVDMKIKASELVESLEKQRRNLDMELQRQEGEGEKDFNERARTYEERSQEELTENINYIKKLAQKEMEELHYEKLSLKREREAISVKKTELKKLHDELYKDVDDVEALRIYLKEERDKLCRSQERFAVFLKEVDICDTCRIPFREFINSGRVPAVEDGNKLSGDSKSTSFIRILASAMVPESSQPIDSLETMACNDHEPSATENSFAESKIQEAPEASSLQPEIKSAKRRHGRDRSNSDRGRSQATKAATSDSKPSNVETTRKRQREQASKNTESEHAAGDSDSGVDSITTGGRRKKRQTAVPVSLAPVQSRYYLRRHKNVGTEDDKASTGTMEKQESVNGDSRTVPSPKDNFTLLEGENRENGKAETLVEAVTHEEIVKVEEETEFKDKSTGKRPVEDPQLGAGGGEIKEHDTNFSMIQEENEEEIEEEETDHPGEASIGKKIWVFFTT